MDDLRATYPDEEEEDADSLYTPLKPPFPVSNGLSHDTTEDDEDDDDDPAPTFAAAALLPAGDSPLVPEPEQEPEPPAAKPENPVADEEGEEEEEDEDDDDGSAAPAHKKQKSLSEFASRSPPPAEAAAAAAAAKPSKKSKKKSNNVWTKSTSRKGKKKAKAPTPNQEDAVLITPVPRFPDKSDDSADAAVCLSKVYKAEKVELSDDRLSAGSSKGYRMVRATRGVQAGAWYFEVKVAKLGPTGHTRLGWSMEKGDLQAPVGYDGNSFGYRDLEGSKVHKAVRERYGEGYGEGDVVGFYISLPDGDSYAPKPPQFVWYKGQSYAYPADGKDEPPKVVPGEFLVSESFDFSYANYGKVLIFSMLVLRNCFLVDCFITNILECRFLLLLITSMHCAAGMYCCSLF